MGDGPWSIERSASSAFAAVVEKGSETQAKLLGQIVFRQRLQQRDGGAERADKRRALGTSAEMALQVAAQFGCEAPVKVFRQQRHQAGAVGHVSENYT